MPYIGKTPSQATRARYYLTASGSETSISGSMTTGGTLTFTDGNFVDVSVNGVALVAGTDYNTNTANTISGLTALTANDQVEIIVYDTFSVFSGDVDSNLSVGGNLSVTGTSSLTGNVSLPDNAKAIFGAGSDLEIFHDGSNSVISDQGTGNLNILASDKIKLGNAAESEIYARFNKDGNVELRHDNSIKFETSSSGVDITGGFTATDGCTITTADNSAQLTLTSTDADGSAGPILVMNRDSGSPDNGDVLGQILYKFDNAAAESTEAIRINGILSDKTDGSEDARFEIKQMFGGSMFSFQTMSKDGIIFNQDSADVDFRVESNGNANMLFVDAGNDRIGIGTSSPRSDLEVSNSGGGELTFRYGGNSGFGAIKADSNNALSFSAGATSFSQKMSLDSGSLGIGIDAASASGRIHAQESNNRHAAFIHNTNASFASSTLQVSTTRNTTDASYNHLNCAIHGVANKMAVRDSGAIVSTNNSIGSISDERMKENIEDATSQWDDIKAVQVRKYNRIGETQKELGVIAQELEASNMGGLVDESEWFDVVANPDNEVRKSVKYSILYMKAVKALQEAMTRIETLEAKVTALENA